MQKTKNTQREIANPLEPSTSTASPQLIRNCNQCGYRLQQAHQLAFNRRVVNTCQITEATLELQKALNRAYFPMLRHLPQLSLTTILILFIARETYADNPLIIARIRSVHSFKSASISANERGGSNT